MATNPAASRNQTSVYSLQNFVQMVNNNFVLFLILGVTFILGYFVGSIMTENQMLKVNGGSGTQAVANPTDTTAGATGPTEEQLSQVPAVTSDDHIRGNADAKVKLIEYSDYECPYCASFHPTMEQVMENYGDQVAWVYRHYPLPFHPQAQPAAETAECVNKVGGQDAFWAYTDSLFELNGGSGTITQANIDQAVSDAGVDATAVQTCVDAGEFTQMITDQMNAGATAGVNGTPGTIIVTDDGQYELINGALPFDQVSQMIEQYL